MNELQKIGEICLDSGILVFGDLINLKKIKSNPHQSPTIYEHAKTGVKYTQGIDFQKYTDILFDNLTVNQLIQEDILRQVQTVPSSELSSENIVSRLAEGFMQINFENGINGKAFAVAQKEGFYGVYAQITENGITKLLIDFENSQEA